MTAGYQAAVGPWVRTRERRLLWAALGALHVLTRAKPDAPRIASWVDRLATAASAPVLAVDWQAYYRAHVAIRTGAGGGSADVALQKADFPPELAPLPDDVLAATAAVVGLMPGVWTDAALAVSDTAQRTIDPARVRALMLSPEVMAHVRAIAPNLRAALRQVMEQAYASGGGPQGFERAIRAAWPEVARRRANMIARTEWARAASAATLAGYQDAGITHAVWITLGDGRVCPVCRGNAAQGLVEVGRAFGGHVKHPPQHPLCRCSIASAYLPVTPEQFPDDGFTDAKAAERWALTKYPDTVFDFAGVHIDALNPTLRQLDRLMQEFPQVAARLQYVGTYSTAPAGVTVHPFSSSEYAHAMGHASGSVRDWIALNRNRYGDPAALRASLVTGRLRAPGETVAHFAEGPGGIEYLITHEFGHLVESYLRSRTNDVFGPALRASGFGGVMSTHHRVMARSQGGRISRYAARSKRETFAEAFAAHYHGAPSVQQRAIVKRLRFWVTLATGPTVRPHGAVPMFADLPNAEKAQALRLLQRMARLLDIDPKEV